VGGVLVAGWAIALAVYFIAAPVLQDPDIEEAQLSKSYERQMEVFGGKATLLGAQLDDWFTSLWHGQNLAYTIAVLTAILALGSFLWCSGRAAPDGQAPRTSPARRSD
jgi:hypothetical protein